MAKKKIQEEGLREMARKQAVERVVTPISNLHRMIRATYRDLTLHVSEEEVRSIVAEALEDRLRRFHSLHNV